MYIRNDENNQPVSTQPGFTTVTQFGGSEGWTTLTYEDFNVDYIRHDENNNPIGVGTYQRHNENNFPVGVGTYQRYDENNDPISQ
jgi:hypothetical protein